MGCSYSAITEIIYIFKKDIATILSILFLNKLNEYIYFKTIFHANKHFQYFHFPYLLNISLIHRLNWIFSNKIFMILETLPEILFLSFISTILYNSVFIIRHIHLQKE